MSRLGLSVALLGLSLHVLAAERVVVEGIVLPVRTFVITHVRVDADRVACGGQLAVACVVADRTTTPPTYTVSTGLEYERCGPVGWQQVWGHEMMHIVYPDVPHPDHQRGIMPHTQWRCR